MQIIKSISEFNKTRNTLTGSIGFVPTMGALHEGHLSLIKTAKSSCQNIIVSIFVNPKQFTNLNDFDNYPRDIFSDIKKLEDINCDVLYSPEMLDIYIEDEELEIFDFNGLDKYMEGIYRKNHFNGVATIIKKLFTIIDPDKAFFGEKDLQQLQIIIVFRFQLLNI